MEADSQKGLETGASLALHRRALSFLPGGVTGDGRRAHPYPIAIARARGKELVDVDGNVYLDYHGGYGTAVLGYSHPEVDEAVARAAAERGAFVGVPHPYEVELAERLCALLPLADRVAFCGGGGSDAIYHAVRLARAATGRTKIVKIEGAYHGWHADVGVSARGMSGPPPRRHGRPVGVPNSTGSLAAATSEVVVVPLNDCETLAAVFGEQGDQLAAMIAEPVAFSLGCVLVDRPYLELARRLCDEHGTVLVFDEVMSGFRAGLAGAGERVGVSADLAAFGKAVANGYILSVLAGRADLMRRLAPEGDVFYSGTFNGHPLSVAAAQATIDVLERERMPDRLHVLGARLAAGVNGKIAELGVRAVCQSWGSVWSIYFNTTEVRDYAGLAASADEATQRINDRFVAFLRESGIFLAPRLAVRGFISAVHDEDDVDRTVAAVSQFLERARDEL